MLYRTWRGCRIRLSDGRRVVRAARRGPAVLVVLGSVIVPALAGAGARAGEGPSRPLGFSLAALAIEEGSRGDARGGALFAAAMPQEAPEEEEAAGPRRQRRQRRIQRLPGDEEPAERDAPPPEGTPILDPPPHFEPFPDRWAIRPPPYVVNEPGRPLDPYRQNVLKGDYPIIGDDIFLKLTFTDRLLVEGRRLPTPAGITGADPDNAAFFGDGEQLFLQNFAVFEVDLFQGQQAFKPVDWRLKSAVVYNTTYLDVQETGVVNVDVAEGTDRLSDYLALQEALIEVHIADLSERYDFLALEAGILPFRSDFRGFIFDDSNLGVRLFGNYDDNKWQYNIAFFNMLEKDTNSELNRLEDRDQTVLIANVYRQDWPVLGYTPSLSLHWSHEDATVEFDRNGVLVRPAPAGLARPHEIDAVYLGFVGEGHIGRVNVTHAFYQVLGRDDDNPFAAREVDINAQFAALELSYDIDWLRPRLFGMYASGDDDTRDGQAEGFDAILEAPNFAGGQFSFFHRQAVRLLGVNLTQRLSHLPDLSTSKLQGQSNFVNPGLLLLGGAFDFEVTPTIRAQVGGSYLRFIETDPLEVYLEAEEIDEEIGVEAFLGIQYRPLLTNNLIFQLGAAPFFPGAGFKKVYQSSEVLFSAFLDVSATW